MKRYAKIAKKSSSNSSPLSSSSSSPLSPSSSSISSSSSSSYPSQSPTPAFFRPPQMTLSPFHSPAPYPSGTDLVLPTADDEGWEEDDETGDGDGVDRAAEQEQFDIYSEIRKVVQETIKEDKTKGFFSRIIERDMVASRFRHLLDLREGSEMRNRVLRIEEFCRHGTCHAYELGKTSSVPEAADLSADLEAVRDALKVQLPENQSPSSSYRHQHLIGSGSFSHLPAFGEERSDARRFLRPLQPSSTSLLPPQKLPHSSLPLSALPSAATKKEKKLYLSTHEITQEDILLFDRLLASNFSKIFAWINERDFSLSTLPFFEHAREKDRAKLLKFFE